MYSSLVACALVRQILPRVLLSDATCQRHIHVPAASALLHSFLQDPTRTVTQKARISLPFCVSFLRYLFSSQLSEETLACQAILLRSATSPHSHHEVAVELLTS